MSCCYDVSLTQNMETHVERARRHLAEAEAHVLRLRRQLATAEEEAARMRESLEMTLEEHRREEEEERRQKRERMPENPPVIPEPTRSSRTGKKGLGGGLKKRHVTPEPMQQEDEEKRLRRIQTLEDDLEYARSKLEDSTTPYGRNIWAGRISEMTNELAELRRAGPIDACVSCNERQAKPGRSFCGSACQREFLCTKMQAFYV